MGGMAEAKTQDAAALGREARESARSVEPQTFLEAVAVASWFNDYGKASFYEGPDANAFFEKLAPPPAASPTRAPPRCAQKHNIT